MSKKPFWMTVIITLTLILVSGSFYYLDRQKGLKETIVADSTSSYGMINDSLTASDSQDLFPGGTSPESNQAPGEESVRKQGGDNGTNDKADITYDKEAASGKPDIGQTVSNPESSNREGRYNNQTSEQTTAVENPSRSGSTYNRLSPGKGIYGQFRYRELGGGRIEIDPQWVAQNIVTITLPGLNRSVQVNRAAKDKFIKAFTYIKNGTAVVNGKEVPLLSLIKTMDGTFVPRHVNWNAANGLSNHSWGTAIDLNASNHYRYVSPDETEDPNRILWEKAFKPAGFSWGNSYSDAMHYELLN